MGGSFGRLQTPHAIVGERALSARTRLAHRRITTLQAQTQGLRAFKLIAEFDGALADDDGVVRKDFRLTEGPIPFDRRTLNERIVRPGQPVCALGRYDASKRALVPRGSTSIGLWPATLDDVRRGVMSKARSQTVLGLSSFLITHALLGVAFYMSETRHSRECAARTQARESSWSRRQSKSRRRSRLDQAPRR